MFALDHPLYWYRYDVSGSIELLRTYVSDIEKQVDAGIKKFEQEATEVEMEAMSEDDSPRVVTLHQGLDDVTWDLRAVFVDYFPGLQRRSALITLFSFFEHELNKVCTRLQSTEKFGISLRDVVGSGVERARTYLCKVASLDLQQAAVQWAEVKSIQAVRNLLVHADGRISAKGKQDPGGVQRYVMNSPYLDGPGEIVIREGFLEHMLVAFEAYFQEVDRAIHQRYGA
jgi:hypothetical protein